MGGAEVGEFGLRGAPGLLLAELGDDECFKEGADQRVLSLEAARVDVDNGSSKPWLTAFGKLRHLRKETAKINRIIEEEFEQIEAEDRL